VTITVREHEWPEVGAWVWKNFEWMSGVSFLPHSDHTYVQAPYEECSEKTYKAMKKAMPNLDWAQLALFEKEDTTRGSQTLACSSGVCEIVDLT
jgi:ribonucleoside-triphosphate reductase